MSGNVKVVSRFRPPNALELREGGEVIVDFDQDDDGSTVKIKGGPSSGPEADGFTFDHVFSMDARQQDVFQYGIKETVDDVISGYNGTILAYGQTGSGKTFTMMGSDIDDKELKGIVPRITEQIFASIMASPSNLEYLVKVSYMEIYMERIRDLLAPYNDNLQIHEEKSKGVYVKGLSDYYVGGQDDVYDIMRQGGLVRSVASTNMNSESSRSHSIFLITVENKNTDTGSQKTGHLYLVDLAGSEKVAKTGASGQTLEEAKKINKSLSALGMVINALTDGKSSHIPYRDSKLTRILQESLGGNSRTTLIINASPCLYNLEETLSTLRFGVRAKSIRNKARVNAELSPASLKVLLRRAQSEADQYQRVVEQLEGELNIWRAGGQVVESERADLRKAAGPATPRTPRVGSTSSRTRPQSPTVPATPATAELIRRLTSRPQTPPALPMDKDEREEFLRRKNYLSDELCERENALSAAETTCRLLREELLFYRDQKESMSSDNLAMATELNTVRVQLEHVSNQLTEAADTMSILKEHNADLTKEIARLKQSFDEKISAASRRRDAAGDGKDLRNTVRVAEDMKDMWPEDLRALALLDNLSLLDRASGPPEELASIREAMQSTAQKQRELSALLKEAQKDRDFLLGTHEEHENRLMQMQEALLVLISGGDEPEAMRAQLEIQLSSLRSELTMLKRQVEQKGQEFTALRAQNESLKTAHEKLSRAFDTAMAATQSGQDLVQTAREMESARKTMSEELAEFDKMRNTLVEDFQDRCAKIIDLEISLEDSREQYRNILHSCSTKAQQKKASFLERSLDQLTAVQKQLVEENVILKQEVAVAERKLLARDERIKALSALVSESQDKLDQQNARYKAQMALVRACFEQAKSLSSTVLASSPGLPSLGFGRIAKPLRGGGARATSQPAPAGPLVGTDAQEQTAMMSTTSPKARNWFFSSS